MIYETGFMLPSKEQVKMIKERADESFCTSAPHIGTVPIVPGYKYCNRELTALTLKNVEPHNDPWVGHYKDGDGEDGPDGRRAIFWVLHLPEHAHMHIQVGTMSARLIAGSWVLFDDRVLHGVYSARKWWGLSYQLRPST